MNPKVRRWLQRSPGAQIVVAFTISATVMILVATGIAAAWPYVYVAVLGR